MQTLGIGMALLIAVAASVVIAHHTPELSALSQRAAVFMEGK